MSSTKCLVKLIQLVHGKDKVTEVTIVPGVTTGELMETFAKYHVCFPSDVILMNVTYGGTLTTGCHVSEFLVVY